MNPTSSNHTYQHFHDINDPGQQTKFFKEKNNLLKIIFQLLSLCGMLLRHLYSFFIMKKERHFNEHQNDLTNSYIIDSSKSTQNVEILKSTEEREELHSTEYEENMITHLSFPQSEERLSSEENNNIITDPCSLQSTTIPSVKEDSLTSTASSLAMKYQPNILKINEMKTEHAHHINMTAIQEMQDKTIQKMHRFIQEEANILTSQLERGKARINNDLQICKMPSTSHFIYKVTASKNKATIYYEKYLLSCHLKKRSQYPIILPQIIFLQITLSNQETIFVIAQTKAEEILKRPQPKNITELCETWNEISHFTRKQDPQDQFYQNMGSFLYDAKITAPLIPSLDAQDKLGIFVDDFSPATLEEIIFGNKDRREQSGIYLLYHLIPKGKGQKIFDAFIRHHTVTQMLSEHMPHTLEHIPHTNDSHLTINREVFMKMARQSSSIQGAKKMVKFYHSRDIVSWNGDVPLIEENDHLLVKKIRKKLSCSDDARRISNKMIKTLNTRIEHSLESYVVTRRRIHISLQEIGGEQHSIEIVLNLLKKAGCIYSFTRRHDNNNIYYIIQA